jgi:hypothetical protein
MDILIFPEETKSFLAPRIIKTIKLTAIVKTRTPSTISF